MNTFLSKLRSFFFERTILTLGILACVGVVAVVWHLSRLSSELIEKTAIQESERYAQALTEFRSLYTSEVVIRAKAQGMTITHDYETREGAIPLPATLSMLLGNRLAQASAGGAFRLYSDYPFSWRTDGGPRDAFEREALRQLRAQPDVPYYQFEERNGEKVLRYATADLMRSSCVQCHNSHADSPKTDWKVGDVRGVLSITHPMETLIAETYQGLAETFGLLIGLLGIGLGGVALVIGKFRHASLQLEDRVLERTAELQEREEYIRLIIDRALDGVISLDSQGVITNWNPQAERKFGWSKAEAVGKPWASMIFPSESREVLESGLQHYVATGEGRLINQRMEMTALHRDGHEFPIELSIAPIHRDSSVIFSAFVRDITMRKQAEENLIALKRHIELILHSAGEGIFGLDREGRITFVNPAAARMIGWEIDELNGKPQSDILPTSRLNAVELSKFLV